MWHQVWLPTKNHKKLQSQPFLCGSCGATKLLSGPPSSDVSQEIILNNTSQVDDIDHFGRRHNVRISGVVQKSGEVVYERWLMLHKKQVLLSRRRTSAVSQTNYSKNGAGNQHCKICQMPHEI